MRLTVLAFLPRMAAMRVLAALHTAVLLGVLLSAAVAACSSGGPSDGATSSASGGPEASGTPSGPVPRDPSRPRVKAHVREGGTLARGVGDDALYLADEDHGVLRRVPLPLREDTPATWTELPGAPAQVLPLDGRILVTIRDPGLLLILEPDGKGGLGEKARVALADDAWGIAITPDERTAFVTSAWTHRVAAVDLDAAKVMWSVDVAREPRGIVVKPDGKTAYVTHLVGAALTRLDGIDADPKVSSVVLPPGPLRAPSGVTLSASLGYAAALDPEGKRLFVARHALGALGEESWFGASTVDVLLTGNDTPLAMPRRGGQPFLRADKSKEGADIAVPGKPLSPFTQPRALAYRKRTKTLLVASEGDDTLVELDALGVDPTRSVLRTHRMGAARDALASPAIGCGAPSGIALSDDEATAWVWCRSTYYLAAVALDDFAIDSAPKPDAVARPAVLVRIAEDTLEADGAIGRRLFYDASDRITGGGVGCAGCHPEGRDDGHVWHEAKINTTDGTQVNFLGHQANIPVEEGVRGVARRTPMLAGRVAANGPYGWHGESKDLPARLHAGFGLHRWGGMPKHEVGNLQARSARLTTFLRKGLVPPPPLRRELDATEIRGRELFNSPAVGCSTCHAPGSEYTDRAAYPIPRVPLRPGFDEDPVDEYKTPSLRFVAGRPPYFHDGRASSLEWLIDNNDDRMGKTRHLSAADRAALIAFLRTL